MVLFSPPQQAIDAQTIKDVCTKYIFNKAPAIAAVGMLLFVDFWDFMYGSVSRRFLEYQEWLNVIINQQSVLYFTVSYKTSSV